MLSAEAVRGLQEELFSPKSSSKGRKKKKPRGKKNALARPDHLGKVAHRQKPKRRLTATTEEEALDELVPQSHKSAAAALAVSQLLDQRKRDYLSAEMFKVMNSKKEWVGSPSSSLQLTFSSTANFHIINKQDLLNHDRFRSNPKFNNIIARGAYLQRFDYVPPRRPTKAERQRRKRETGFRVQTPALAAARADERRRRGKLLRSSSAIPSIRNQALRGAVVTTSANHSHRRTVSAQGARRCSSAQAPALAQRRPATAVRPVEARVEASSSRHRESADRFAVQSGQREAVNIVE